MTNDGFDQEGWTYIAMAIGDLTPMDDSTSVQKMVLMVNSKLITTTVEQYDRWCESPSDMFVQAIAVPPHPHPPHLGDVCKPVWG